MFIFDLYKNLIFMSFIPNIGSSSGNHQQSGSARGDAINFASPHSERFSSAQQQARISSSSTESLNQVNSSHVSSRNFSHSIDRPNEPERKSYRRSHPYFSQLQSFQTKINERIGRIIKWNSNLAFEFNLIQNVNKYCTDFFKYLKYYKINKNNLIEGTTIYLPEYLDSFNHLLEEIPNLEKIKNNLNFLAAKSYITLSISLCECFVSTFEIHRTQNYLDNQKELEKKFKDFIENHLEKKVHEDTLSLTKQLEKIRKRLSKIKNNLSIKRRPLFVKMFIGFLQVISSIGSKWITQYPEIISEYLFRKIFKDMIRICKEMQNVYTVYTAGTLAKQWISHLKPLRIINKHRFIKRSPEIKIQAIHLIKELQQMETVDVYKKLDALNLSHLKPHYSLLKEKEINPLTEANFCRTLKKAYFSTVHKQVDTESLLMDLKQQEVSFDEQVEKSLPIINEQIQAAQKKSQEATDQQDPWEIIKDYFKTLSIDLDQLTFIYTTGPQLSNTENLIVTVGSKEQWEWALKQPDFHQHLCIQKQLARQWVKHQHAVAQLSKQALFQAISSKIRVEEKLMVSCFIEHLVKIVSCGFNLTSRFLLTKYILDFVKINNKIPLGVLISIPLGILFSILYPEIDLSIESLTIQLSNRIFACYFKPNEYGIQGFSLSFQKQWVDFKGFVSPFISTLKKLSLWIILKFEKIIFSRSREYCLEREKTLEDRINQTKQTYTNKSCQLKTSLTKLRLKDVEFKAFSSIHKIQKEASRKHQETPPIPIKPLTNNEKALVAILLLNPLAHIAEALDKINVSCFPAHVHQFFKGNLGIKLRQKNPDKDPLSIHNKLEKFFELEEEKFFETYRIQLFKPTLI
jgi:hypothetical protein